MRFVKNDGSLSEPPEIKNLDMDIILDHIEAIIISAAEPPMNSQGGRFGKNVEFYLQARDKRVPESDIPQVLSEIVERLEGLEATIKK